MDQEKGLFLDNMPESNNIWKEIGGNYETAQQSINELVDNSISNIIGNNSKTKRIEITLEETNDIDQSIIISIEDSGIGIEDPAQAFTLGSIGNDSVFNEHGFGWKQALSAANPENDAWEMYIRNGKDMAKDKIMHIKAPYIIGKQKYDFISNREYPGHPWGMTFIRVRCNFILFRNLIDAEISIRSSLKFDFNSIADRIYEDLGFTYSELLEKYNITLTLTLRHYNATSESYEVTPLNPIWKSQPLSFKNEELHFECMQGFMEPLPDRTPFNNKSSNRYYKQNLTSSGVEIRINGRVVEHNLFEEIYGMKKHPSFNGYLIKINIISNNRDELPSTRTTKNGFRIGDERLSKIYSWLRKNLRPSRNRSAKPISVSESEQKKKLAEIIERQYYDGRELELSSDIKITQREVPLFTSMLKSGYPKADLIVTTGEKVTIIEAKKDEATCKDVWQLKMYCDGYYLDHGKMPDSAVLVAKEFPDSLKRIISFFNKNDRHYPEITYRYWNDYMKNFEDVIREEKKLKLMY